MKRPITPDITAIIKATAHADRCWHCYSAPCKCPEGEGLRAEAKPQAAVPEPGKRQEDQESSFFAINIDSTDKD